MLCATRNGSHYLVSMKGFDAKGFPVDDCTNSSPEEAFCTNTTLWENHFIHKMLYRKNTYLNWKKCLPFHRKNYLCCKRKPKYDPNCLNTCCECECEGSKCQRNDVTAPSVQPSEPHQPATKQPTIHPQPSTSFLLVTEKPSSTPEKRCSDTFWSKKSTNVRSEFCFVFLLSSLAQRRSIVV